MQGAKFHLGFLKGEGCWRERYSGLLKNYSERNAHLYDGAALILLKYSVTETEAVAQMLMVHEVTEVSQTSVTTLMRSKYDNRKIKKEDRHTQKSHL